MGSIQEHYPCGGTHPRDHQLCGRCRVQDPDRPNGLEPTPRVIREGQYLVGPLEVDLFASRLSNQLPRFFSWRPYLLVEATDAFSQQ